MAKNNRKNSGQGRANSESQRGGNYGGGKSSGVLELPGYTPVFPNVVYQRVSQVLPQRNLVTRKFEPVVDLLRIFRYTTPTEDELKRILAENIEHPNKEKLEILMTFGKSRIDFPYHTEFLQLSLERVAVKSLAILKSLSKGVFDLNKYECFLSAQNLIFGHIVCFGLSLPIIGGRISPLLEIKRDLSEEIVSGRHYVINQDSPLNNRDETFREIRKLSEYLQDKDKLKVLLDITPRVFESMARNAFSGYTMWREKLESKKTQQGITIPVNPYELHPDPDMIRNPRNKKEGN